MIKFPDVLILHLKRFRKVVYRNMLSYDKMGDLIEFPIDHLDLNKYKLHENQGKKIDYELFGVINHFGNCGGGHYTAFCKNFLDDKWYNFDDSDV